MKQESKKMIVYFLTMILFSCSRTEFAPVQEQQQMSKVEVPLDPVDVLPSPDPVQPVPEPIVPPVLPITSSKLSNGSCGVEAATKVLSCLSCQSENLPVPAQLSVKAQALVDVMFLACQIPNKSDKNNFQPTKEMIIKKLNRGSEALYPETARTSQMSLVIAGLTNINDVSLRQKMFGGLWYQPPFSDAFETYFGLTVQEAKSTFCWDGQIQTPQITGVSGLFSKQWLDCQYGADPFSCKELPSYTLAQGYRNQLQNVLSVSISNPYVPPTLPSNKKCTWEKFEGDDLDAAKKQIQNWKSLGRQVSVEINKADGVGACSTLDMATLPKAGKILLASVVCQ